MTMAVLASAVEMPEHRQPGLLAVLQRVVNVEGYPILDRQDAASTVVWKVPLIYVPDPEPDSAFVITAMELTGKPLAAYRHRMRRKRR